jgi:hypothetical protein
MSSNDLSECSVISYINPGPFLDDTSKETFYNTVLETDIISFKEIDS